MMRSPPKSPPRGAAGGAPSLKEAHEQLQQQYQTLVDKLHYLQLHQQQPANVDQQNEPAAAAPNDHVPQQPQPQNQAEEVHAVHNLKIPPFWRENPVLWFAQVEAAFALFNIRGDATRFRHVITQLDTRTLPAIADLIVNPPPEHKYDAIKNRIVGSFAETSESKMRKLLRGLEPTNEKPSLLLQRIRNLADGQVGDALLRTLFLEQLPEYVRAVLVISGDLDLSALATQADRVMEATNSTQVAAVQQPAQNKEVAAVSRDSAITELLAAVTALSREVKTMKNDMRSSRSRSSSRHRGDAADNNNDSSSSLCFFHAKFGDDARKCQKPCAKASAAKHQGN